MASQGALAALQEAHIAQHGALVALQGALAAHQRAFMTR